MHIFIAGATGVLGRRVVPRLIAAGHHVAALSRSDANARQLAESGAEPRPGDLFDKEAMIRLTRDCDVIMHLATAIPKTSRAKPRDWAVNDRIRRKGTMHLVSAGLRNRCRLYIQQSITYLYGNRGGAWVDETTPIASEIPAAARSALDMEKTVSDASAQSNLPALILRFGSFYSHDSSHTQEMFGAIRRGRFPVFGAGNAYWNLINVDDAAEALVKAVEKVQSPAGDVVNVCDDEPVLYSDLVDFIASTLAARRPMRIPEFVARILIGSEGVNFLLSSVRCRNDKAKQLLGWAPGHPTYREGVKAEVAKWMAAVGEK